MFLVLFSYHKRKLLFLHPLNTLYQLNAYRYPNNQFFQQAEKGKSAWQGTFLISFQLS